MNESHSRYAVADFATIEPVRCPCGWARRALGSIPGAPLSVHMVDIEQDAQTHSHNKHTEVYVVLECEEGSAVELDGQRFSVGAGACIYIPPGVRHRAVGKMRILNIVLPPFDPEDEELED